MMKVDQKQLADVFGVSTRTIRAWQRDGMPAEGDRNSRKYDTEDCISWYVAHRAEGGSVSSSENGGPPPEEVSDRRWKAARAEKRHLELRERRGELIRFEDVQALVTEVAERIRRRLLNLPGRRLKEVAAETELAEVKKIRDEAVREILKELEDGFVASAEEVEAGQEP